MLPNPFSLLTHVHVYSCVFPSQLSSCSLNKFFISSTLIVSVAVSIVAILPWIQKGKHLHILRVLLLVVYYLLCVRVCVVQPKSGLLQASIVTAYCTYVTWSAIATEPYGEGKSFGYLLLM